MYAYVNGAPTMFTDPDGLRLRNARPGGSSYDRRQWNRHGPKPFPRPNGEGTESAWDAGGGLFTPDPAEGDYRVRCLRWECKQDSCTPGKAPTDFLPAANFTDDAPSGCQCVQTTMGPIYNPPTAKPQDVFDVVNRKWGKGKR